MDYEWMQKIYRQKLILILPVYDFVLFVSVTSSISDLTSSDTPNKTVFLPRGPQKTFG